MTETIVSPTGEVAALMHEAMTPVELFTARAIRNFSVAAGAVQAGNVAAPGAFTDRDFPTPLAGLAASRVSVEGLDLTGLYVEVEATATGTVTTILYTLLTYTSEDGVTWHLASNSEVVADTTALVSGNPSDQGFTVGGGTDKRAFNPFGGKLLPSAGPPYPGRFLAIAIRNNNIGALTPSITVSARIVERMT